MDWLDLAVLYEVWYTAIHFVIWVVFRACKKGIYNLVTQNLMFWLDVQNSNLLQLVHCFTLFGKCFSKSAKWRTLILKLDAAGREMLDWDVMVATTVTHKMISKSALKCLADPVDSSWSLKHWWLLCLCLLQLLSFKLNISGLLNYHIGTNIRQPWL